MNTQEKDLTYLDRINLENVLGLIDPPSPIGNQYFGFQTPDSGGNENDSFPKTENNIGNDSIISDNY